MAPTGSGQHPVFVRTLKMAKPSSLFWRFSLLAHCHSLILPQPQFLVISLFACVMLRRLWNFIWLPLPKCSCFSPYLIPLLPWVDVRPCHNKRCNHFLVSASNISFCLLCSTFSFHFCQYPNSSYPLPTLLPLVSFHSFPSSLNYTVHPYDRH